MMRERGRRLTEPLIRCREQVEVSGGGGSSSGQGHTGTTLTLSGPGGKKAIFQGRWRKKA